MLQLWKPEVSPDMDKCLPQDKSRTQLRITTQINGSQSEVLESPVSPRNLLDIQIRGMHTDLLNQHLHVNKIPQVILNKVKEH